MNRALISGSFDPITLGHIDIIGRSLELFDEVVICIFINPNKKPMFSLKEREDMIKKSLKEINGFYRLKIDSYEGLVVDYMIKNNINIIIRGLRNFSDFEYESEMSLINNKLYPKIETIFLMTKDKLSYIRSSVIRQIVEFGGSVDGFVPKSIEKDIIRKFLEA